MATPVAVENVDQRETHNEAPQTEINGPKRSADGRIDLITPGETPLRTL